MGYYYQKDDNGITTFEVEQAIESELQNWGKLDRVLLVVPDYTRMPSQAGIVAKAIYDRLKSKSYVEFLVACGTHLPMSDEELDLQYPTIPHNLFSFHNWRVDPIKVGEVPGEFIDKVSNGLWTDKMDVCLNKRLFEKWDKIISIGQVVPHEVVGMSNYTKNFVVGTGGAEFINSTHILGAFCGLEQVMGQDNSPVRKVYDYTQEHFLNELPITYIFTVTNGSEDGIKIRGLFCGESRETFEKAVELSQKANMIFLDKPLKKCVVYLDPVEFHTLWLGNKSIYRTRMAMADGGQLIVLAPAVNKFGEDDNNDAMIRKYGYIGRNALIKCCKDEANCSDLRDNLSAAAHLIHGSSDDRFTITYCTQPTMEAEIKSVHFQWADVNEMMKIYDPKKLKDGYNEIGGEEVFFVSNPAIGLWSTKQRYKEMQGE